MRELSAETCPEAFFDAHPFRQGPDSAREAFVRALARRLNHGFFAVVRGVTHDGTSAAQLEAERFMVAPTHSYPWSTDGARVLLRGLDPAARASFPALAAACDPAAELFRATAEACLTSAERGRVAGGHVTLIAPPIVQRGETWRVHHGLHNDSRRASAQMPLIASFLIEESAGAGGLVVWPGNAESPGRLVTQTGDLCLLRDSIEATAGRVLYPITHGTAPADGPGRPARIVAIFRMGILPLSTVDAVKACTQSPMDLYLDTVAGAVPMVAGAVPMVAGAVPMVAGAVPMVAGAVKGRRKE